MVLKPHFHCLPAPDHHLSELHGIRRNMQLRDSQVGAELNQSSRSAVQLDIYKVLSNAEFGGLPGLEIHIEVHPTVRH